MEYGVWSYETQRAFRNSGKLTYVTGRVLAIELAMYGIVEKGI
jgi:hypothetical protein